MNTRLAAACLVLATAAARGDVIPTVFGTGVDALGGLLPAGATDPHYTLVQYPGQVGTTPAPSFVLTSLASTYVPNGPASKWVSWSATLQNATPAGSWVYRTTFDLTGFDPVTAVLTGRIASDDDVTILLNGVSTGLTFDFNNQLSNFNIATGFVPGVNTLDFRVNNAPFVAFNPSGLRVDLVGTAVPEPSSLVLAGAALAAAAFRRRRS